MKKRKSETYLQPATLGDLRQIVLDHEDYSSSTRVWIHSHSNYPGEPDWYSVEVSHAEEPQ